MGIACDSNGCRHNDGNGFCELEDIYISEAETGDPICQDADYEENE